MLLTHLMVLVDNGLFVISGKPNKDTSLKEAYNLIWKEIDEENSNHWSWNFGIIYREFIKKKSQLSNYNLRSESTNSNLAFPPLNSFV